MSRNFGNSNRFIADRRSRRLRPRQWLATASVMWPGHCRPVPVAPGGERYGMPGELITSRISRFRPSRRSSRVRLPRKSFVGEDRRVKGLPPCLFPSGNLAHAAVYWPLTSNPGRSFRMVRRNWASRSRRSLLTAVFAAAPHWQASLSPPPRSPARGLVQSSTGLKSRAVSRFRSAGTRNSGPANSARRDDSSCRFWTGILLRSRDFASG